MDPAKAHFGFTKLVVADLDGSAAFYATVFGMVEQRRVHAEIAGRAIDEILFSNTAPGAATFVLLRFADERWDPLESTCRHASLSIL